jgi:hypothetical protein
MYMYSRIGTTKKFTRLMQILLLLEKEVVRL